MKEYCLVPRKKVEEDMRNESSLYPIKNNMEGGEKKKDKRKRKKVIKNSTKKKMKKSAIAKKDPLPLPVKQQPVNNPDLDFLLDMSFTKALTQYAKSFLNYLKNKPNIAWDEMGYLQRPFSGYNVVNMMKKLISSNTSIEVDELPFYKMLISLSSIPYEAIRNTDAVNQLKGIKAQKKKPRGASLRGNGWNPY